MKTSEEQISREIVNSASRSNDYMSQVVQEQTDGDSLRLSITPPKRKNALASIWNGQNGGTNSQLNRESLTTNSRSDCGSRQLSPRKNSIFGSIWSSVGGAMSDNKNSMPGRRRSIFDSALFQLKSDAMDSTIQPRNAPRRKSMVESIIAASLGYPDPADANPLQREAGSNFAQSRALGDFQEVVDEPALLSARLSAGNSSLSTGSRYLMAPAMSGGNANIDHGKLRDLMRQSYRVGLIDEAIYTSVRSELERHDLDGIVNWLFCRANGNLSKFIRLLKGSVWQAMSPGSDVRGALYLSVPILQVGQGSYSMTSSMTPSELIPPEDHSVNIFDENEHYSYKIIGV